MWLSDDHDDRDNDRDDQDNDHDDHHHQEVLQRVTPGSQCLLPTSEIRNTTSECSSR